LSQSLRIRLTVATATTSTTTDPHPPHESPTSLLVKSSPRLSAKYLLGASYRIPICLIPKLRRQPPPQSDEWCILQCRKGASSVEPSIPSTLSLEQSCNGQCLQHRSLRLRVAARIRRILCMSGTEHGTVQQVTFCCRILLV
jgi:hypothetical protein